MATNLTSEQISQIIAAGPGNTVTIDGTIYQPSFAPGSGAEGNNYGALENIFSYLPSENKVGGNVNWYSPTGEYQQTTQQQEVDNSNLMMFLAAVAPMMMLPGGPLAGMFGGGTAAGAGVATGALGPAELAIAAGEGIIPITAAEAATAGLTSSQLAALGSGIGLSGSSLLSNLPAFLKDTKNLTSLARAGLTIAMINGAPALVPTGDAGTGGGGGGGGGPFTPTVVSAGPAPAPPPPLTGSSGTLNMNDPNYYNAIQQYYNRYMPGSNRNIASELSAWYSGDYGMFAPSNTGGTGAAGTGATGTGATGTGATGTTRPAGFNQGIYNEVEGLINSGRPQGEIAGIINSRLAEMGYTREQLATALGIPLDQVNAYLNGAATGSTNTAANVNTAVSASPLSPEQVASYYNATVGRGLMSEKLLVDELTALGVDTDTLSSARGLLTSGQAGAATAYNQSFTPDQIKQAIQASISQNPDLKKEDLKILAATQYGVDPFEFDRQWSNAAGGSFIEKYKNTTDPIIREFVRTMQRTQDIYAGSSTSQEAEEARIRLFGETINANTAPSLAQAYQATVGQGIMTEDQFIRDALSRGATEADLIAARNLILG